MPRLSSSADGAAPTVTEGRADAAGAAAAGAANAAADDADADADAAAELANPTGSTPAAERGDEVKTHLTTLRSRNAELRALIERAEEEHVAVVDRARALRDGIELMQTDHETVRAEMASAERELDAIVNAPVSGGRDPFEWLPDELIVMTMLVLPF